MTVVLKNQLGLSLLFYLLLAQKNDSMLPMNRWCMHGRYLAYATIKFFQDSAQGQNHVPVRAVCCPKFKRGSFF